jgi:phage terminase Nu1 subunit (DNA packaging protein)
MGNCMTTVDEIIAAAERLTPAQFARLRQRLDRLEQKHWDNELSHMDSKMKQAGLTDDDIDEMVTRRRRESRR